MVISFDVSCSTTSLHIRDASTKLYCMNQPVKTHAAMTADAANQTSNKTALSLDIPISSFL
jgi:hypothetical protein